MKVAFIMGYFSDERIGGSEVQAKMIAKKLIDQGMDIFFLCNENRRAEGGHNSEFRIHRVKERYKGLRVLQYLNRKNITRILDEERPDVLIHRGRIDFADITYDYAKKMGIPIITSITSKRYTIKPRFRPTLSLPIKVLDHFLMLKSYRISDIIISQTTEEKLSLKKELGFESIIIPNCHSVPAGPFRKDHPPLVVWVANIKPLKQVELFIELAEVKKSTNMRFAIIGNFEDEDHKQTIMEKIKCIKNIEYLGGMTLDDTNEVISRASVLVNTSEPDSEGFPNTYIQAWMREVPVLCLHNDPDGLVRSEGLGRSSGSMEGMKKDLDDILADGERLTEMGKKCREFAIDRFNDDLIGKKYFELIKGLHFRRVAK